MFTDPSRHTGSLPETVWCRYGIHSVAADVIGMRLGDARRLLAQLLGIPEAAVAVIDGEIAGEGDIVEADVEFITWIRRSTVMGPPPETIGSSSGEVSSDDTSRSIFPEE